MASFFHCTTPPLDDVACVAIVEGFILLTKLFLLQFCAPPCWSQNIKISCLSRLAENDCKTRGYSQRFPFLDWITPGENGKHLRDISGTKATRKATQVDAFFYYEQLLSCSDSKNTASLPTSNDILILLHNQEKWSWYDTKRILPPIGARGQRLSLEVARNANGAIRYRSMWEPPTVHITTYHTCSLSVFVVTREFDVMREGKQ